MFDYQIIIRDNSGITPKQSYRFICGDLAEAQAAYKAAIQEFKDQPYVLLALLDYNFKFYACNY